MNRKVISQENTNKLESIEAFTFDPLLPEFIADPYPIYHRLRSNDPVHLNFMGFWVLTRYADIKAVLRDPRFSHTDLPKRIKDKNHYLDRQQGNFDALAQATNKWLFFLDPPDHTRLRKLLSKDFSPNMVKLMRPQIQEIVDELIDSLQDRGSMEIISDLAIPLPVLVVARILGASVDTHSQVKLWAKELSRVFEPLKSLETYVYLNKITQEFTEYLRDLIAEREKKPKEDLLSTLIAAREQGDRLSQDELLGICIMLLSAGEQATINLIGNGMLALLRHPDQMEKLKREPTIIESAVEELLRYDSPVQFISRKAIEDVEIGGKTIRAGQAVLLSLGAANRDPAQFSQPDRLDLCRSENPHLAFADGIHHCLGGPLARVQGQIAINTLVQRFPDLKLSTDTLEWVENIGFRSLKALPVTFTP
ncbi:cytochrome P450 [Scytonema sp. PCC 10023]|uniref:cytochrome P450 n=1 Tax=Scytonema sp. PCC 10023 TaxID=1680591 RepID=UPI0039C6E343